MALQSMTALASITLQAASASVSFSGIPQNYRDLILVTAGPGLVSGFVLQLIHFNNDLTNSNYSSVRIYGTGSSAASDTAASPRIGNIYQNNINNTIVQIMDYSATDKHKTYLARQNMPNDILMAEAGRWANTSAINQLAISADGSLFLSGQTFNLYGRIA